MPRKAKALVLDSWAIMAYFQDEPAGEKVANIIADAHDDDIPLLISIVNAGEIWNIITRKTSAADADQAIRQIQDLGIKFVDADWDLAHGAGYFKLRNKMSFADCAAAALAKQRKAHLVTGDSEFKQVEQEITINWL